MRGTYVLHMLLLTLTERSLGSPILLLALEKTCLILQGREDSILEQADSYVSVPDIPDADDQSIYDDAGQKLAFY